MFREGYYLNVPGCERSECARQSAAQISRFLSYPTQPFELTNIRFYLANKSTGFWGDSHTGTTDVDLNAPELLSGEKLYQFAYLTPAARSRLKTVARGVNLKQSFTLPRNFFNVNLEQKYKPYVRNQIVLSCPRSNNNCVWPNPIPKYTIKLNP